MGGTIALALAIRHPDKVNRLIVVSGTYSTAGIYPEMLAMVDFITPEIMAGSPPDTEYRRVAPNPDAFPTLVTKLVALTKSPQDWSPESIQAISAPTLIVVGDSDQVTPEHAVGLFRLRGGGVPGDVAGLPASQLAVIPGATHSTVADRVDLLTPIVNHFLSTPAAPTP
jgi:pimeloyl-ACP methyl ester carboxylesterase